MKKGALFLAMILAVLPLFAKVSTVWNFDAEESVLSAFEKKLVSRLSPLSGEDETAEFLSWEEPMLTLSLFGEERKVPIGENTIDEAVESLLYYNSHFTSDAPLTLDWIYDRSFSSSSELKKGSVYKALSPSGRTVGLLFADKNDGTITELSVIRSSSLVPGLELKKTSPWLFSLSMGTVFTPSVRLSFDIEVSNLSVIYPFRPVIKAKYARDAVNNAAFLFSAGIGYHFPLSVLFGPHVPILSDSLVGADCFMTLGSAGTFVYGGGYEISLTWLISDHFGLCFGMEANKIRNDKFSYFSIDTVELKTGVTIR